MILRRIVEGMVAAMTPSVQRAAEVAAAEAGLRHVALALGLSDAAIDATVAEAERRYRESSAQSAFYSLVDAYNDVRDELLRVD